MTILPLGRVHALITDDELRLDRREFQRIYHGTWADVFRYAFVLLGHREDAEDVASEAFRRPLLRHARIGGCSPERGSAAASYS